MRRMSAVIAVLLVALGAVAGVIAWRTLRPKDPPYQVSLRAVPPMASNWWLPGGDECPSGGRGEGPPRSTGVNSVVATGQPGVATAQPVGPGQMLVYELVVQAGSKAPGLGDLTATIELDQPEDTPAFASEGILCAFVNDVDPATTSQRSAASVTVQPAAEGDSKDVRAEVRVTSLEAESTAVVELWAQAAEELDRGTTSFLARLDGVQAPPGTNAEVLDATARVSRSTNSRLTPEIDLAVDQDPADLKPGGAITYRMRVSNATPSDVVNPFTVVFEADSTIDVSTVAVLDSTGTPVTCSATGGLVRCAGTYLAPQEVVTVVIEGTVAADTPTLFDGSGDRCTRQQQDLCARAEVEMAANQGARSKQVELATDLPTSTDVSIGKVVSEDRRALYVGRNETFTYVLRAGDAPVSQVTVNDPSCGPLVQVGTDSDSVLAPGETWTFQCEAVVDRSQADDVTVTAVDAAGQPVGSVGRLAIPILEPSLSLRSLDNRNQATVEILNSGDTLLADLVVEGRGCDRAGASGDSDDDGALDPGERWIVPCQQRTGKVRAYAVDVAGGAVTGVIDG